MIQESYNESRSGGSGCIKFGFVGICVIVALIAGIIYLISEGFQGILTSGNLKEAQEYNEGTAWAKVGGKWTLYDNEGNALMQYKGKSSPTRFALGVCVVGNKMINRQGETVFEWGDDLTCFDQRNQEWRETFSGYVVLSKNIISYEDNYTMRGIVGPDGNWIYPLEKDFLDGFTYDKSGFYRKKIGGDYRGYEYQFYNIVENQFHSVTSNDNMWRYGLYDLKYVRSSYGSNDHGFYNIEGWGFSLSKYTLPKIKTSNGFLGMGEEYNYRPEFIGDYCNLYHVGADRAVYVVRLNKIGEETSSVFKVANSEKEVDHSRLFKKFVDNGSALIWEEYTGLKLPEKGKANTYPGEFKDGIALIKLHREQFISAQTKLYKTYYVDRNGEKLKLKTASKKNGTIFIKD